MYYASVLYHKLRKLIAILQSWAMTSPVTVHPNHHIITLRKQMTLSKPRQSYSTTNQNMYRVCGRNIKRI